MYTASQTLFALGEDATIRHEELAVGEDTWLCAAGRRDASSILLLLLELLAHWSHVDELVDGEPA